MKGTNKKGNAQASLNKASTYNMVDSAIIVNSSFRYSIRLHFYWEKFEEVWYRLRLRRKEKIPKWRIVNAILEKQPGDLDCPPHQNS